MTPEKRPDGTPVRKLTGQKMAAPCWWCSRALHGGRGVTAKVDGNEVALHAACKADLLTDPDFGSRVSP